MDIMDGFPKNYTKRFNQLLLEKGAGLKAEAVKKQQIQDEHYQNLCRSFGKKAIEAEWAVTVSKYKNRHRRPLSQVSELEPVSFLNLKEMEEGIDGRKLITRSARLKADADIEDYDFILHHLDDIPKEWRCFCFWFTGSPLAPKEYGTGASPTALLWLSWLKEDALWYAGITGVGYKGDVNDRLLRRKK